MIRQCCPSHPLQSKRIYFFLVHVNIHISRKYHQHALQNHFHSRIHHPNPYHNDSSCGSNLESKFLFSSFLLSKLPISISISMNVFRLRLRFTGLSHYCCLVGFLDEAITALEIPRGITTATIHMRMDMVIVSSVWNRKMILIPNAKAR